MVNNLKDIMKGKGVTQTALAKMAGISQSTISAILNGNPTTPATLNAICNALGISAQKLSEETTQEITSCPRCGSKAIIEWNNHLNNNCRLRCAFCEADTGEQRDKEHALRVFASFEQSESRRAHANVCVLTLSELLDSSCADADDVRPVWFENRGLFIVPALLQYGLAERELELVKVLWFGSMSAKSYLLSNYGVAWRCWNGRPTAERSEAEAWKD